MKVRNIETAGYQIPTDTPEADGTFAWNSTTIVVVRITDESAKTGLGFTYCPSAAATFIQEIFAPIVFANDTDDLGIAWRQMMSASRNAGLPGIAACSLSAVDIALWDLRAKHLNLPLSSLLPRHRTGTPVYGSGGFTTYTEQDLEAQLTGWVREGIRKVKIKLGKNYGTELESDVNWVRLARQIIGADLELFVDANGAYSPKIAIAQAARFADHGVTYFEEPVSSDHRKQLRFVRERVPMDVAAGEYGYTPWYFRDLLEAHAVDILQADVTRCLGITGWLQAGALAFSHSVRFSAHTAPSIHSQIACAVPQISHIEYFHDHVRIEQMLFDGVPNVRNGEIEPNVERPGLGLEFKWRDAEKWRIRS